MRLLVWLVSVVLVVAVAWPLCAPRRRGYEPQSYRLPPVPNDDEAEEAS